MAKSRLHLNRAYKRAENFLEHDCMACMESWDVPKENGAMELCKFCGSNDIQVRQGIVYRPHNKDISPGYRGADIFSQYNHPGFNYGDDNDEDDDE